MYAQPAVASGGLWLPPGGDEVINRPWRDPTLWSLLFVAVAVVGFGLMRTDNRFAGAPKWYWMEKLVWPGTADLVVVGDSRVYRGVDPAAFSTLGTTRNFGFSSVKLTEDYWDRAAAILDPDGRRIMLVGVSLFAIPGRSDAQEGFQDAKRELSRLRLPLGIARVVSEWELALEPLALDARTPCATAEGSPAPQAGRALASEYQQTFHPDGWVESDRVVPDPVALGMATVRQAFPPGFDRKADLGGLLASMHRLVDDGVCVCAFRPPVPPEIAALEDSLGYLDYAEFAKSCESIGVRWIDVDQAGLRSYDGSHLDGVSARVLSQRLAHAVADACGRVRTPTP
jgi:hypothetical protein